MLQVREKEISPRKWSGVTVQLRTLEGSLNVATILFPFLRNHEWS